MKHILWMLLTGLLVLSCSQNKDTGDKPLDPANMDLTVKAGDDFYEYANGNWLKNNPVPAEYSRWGSFENLTERNLKNLRSIFEAAAKNTDAEHGSNIQKIGDFYAAGMDTTKIEQEGLQPLQAEFRRISGIKDKTDLQHLIAYFHTRGIDQTFYLFSDQDKKNTEMVIAWLYQGGLGLPDRDYYVQQDDRSKEIREAYVQHVTKMFGLMGESADRAQASAKTVMEMETRLAKASMTRLEQRNPKATYHLMSLKKLDGMTPNFNWANYFNTIGVGDPGDINVAQPDFFKEMDRMVKAVSLDDWKTYLSWHLIHNAADYLSTPFVNENFAFYGKFLSGTEELQPRWKRCLKTTSNSLGEAVGQIYVEKYFPPEAKQTALALVMNLKSAFRERIENLEWMSPETKTKALEKLDAFNVKIGYPDKWIDYSDLEIARDSYVLNILRASQFEVKRDLAKIGKPVDRDEWGMYPQTVNAYYHPFLNEIVFPAAILQPPFFNFKADPAVNYGAIGVVIGHEMTHGFDDQGRQYDSHGNMNDWWQKSDEEKFNKRAEVLVNQYNEFTPVDTAHIDGKLTLGENIADLGGITISYNALQKALKEHPQPEKIDGFTPDQRFFLSYAQVWRNNIRKENLLLRLKTDVHSPGKYRTLGPLSNFDPFYAAFSVEPGQKMYRPEAERAKIW